ncbi:polysaccharide biosynthesis/export family protein [Pelorhabdus rhamnosifermentans]|uniref:polysaccharide biosynthesis/export family protein n=1 Tax=Pelorhabdus rhamnosifermentans TaxID=2772457 RepID=UPI001FEBBB19|nr:polysaccharide biosynthesis/export family protein [Pelorhabdus rhamnosifermentans]
MFSRKVIALLISGSLVMGTTAPVFAEAFSASADSTFGHMQDRNEQAVFKYELTKYDVINIVIIGVADNYFNDIMIGPDGYVNLPYAGNVKLAGLTIQEATQLLKSKLGEYIKIPSMSVMVKQYGPRKVYVMGEVGKPGVYELSPDYMNVFAALSSAGGITKRGRPKHVGVVRMEQGQVQMKEINFDNFIEKQDASQNPMLQDGDMIYVPKSNKIDLNEDVMPILSGIGLFKAMTR